MKNKMSYLIFFASLLLPFTSLFCSIWHPRDEIVRDLPEETLYLVRILPQHKDVRETDREIILDTFDKNTGNFHTEDLGYYKIRSWIALPEFPPTNFGKKTEEMRWHTRDEPVSNEVSKRFYIVHITPSQPQVFCSNDIVIDEYSVFKDKFFYELTNMYKATHWIYVPSFDAP